MHIQIINFRLEGMSEEDYRKLTETIAPAFANLPGLVSKTWLANPETNTFGGMYIWQDWQATEDYKETDIYKGISANSNFVDVSSKDFAILENPTQVTRGLAEIGPARANRERVPQRGRMPRGSTFTRYLKERKAWISKPKMWQPKRDESTQERPIEASEKAAEMHNRGDEAA